ncbi:MAG: hypothetical protein ACLR0U_18255 [Enterocloster clostridioformis]
MEWLKENIQERAYPRCGSKPHCQRLLLPSGPAVAGRNQADLIKGAYKLMVPCGYVDSKLTEFTTNQLRMSLTSYGGISTRPNGIRRSQNSQDCRPGCCRGPAAPLKSWER